MATAALGAGKRRSLDVEVNLVSFISLLCMCICFLLMTAVWLQIGSVPVKQSYGTSGAAPSSQQAEIELAFTSATTARLSVTRSGRRIQNLELKADAGREIAKSLESRLPSVLKALGGSRNAAMVSSVMLKPMTAVSYGQLVAVMDVFRRNEISNLGVVSTAQPGRKGGR